VRRPNSAFSQEGASICLPGQCGGEVLGLALFTTFRAMVYHHDGETSSSRPTRALEAGARHGSMGWWGVCGLIPVTKTSTAHHLSSTMTKLYRGRQRYPTNQTTPALVPGDRGWRHPQCRPASWRRDRVCQPRLERKVGIRLWCRIAENPSLYTPYMIGNHSSPRTSTRPHSSA
jgi:hypothetical protein